MLDPTTMVLSFCFEHVHPVLSNIYTIRCCRASYIRFCLKVMISYRLVSSQEEMSTKQIKEVSTFTMWKHISTFTANTISTVVYILFRCRPLQCLVNENKLGFMVVSTFNVSRLCGPRHRKMDLYCWEAFLGDKEFFYILCHNCCLISILFLLSNMHNLLVTGGSSLCRTLYPNLRS